MAIKMKNTLKVEIWKATHNPFFSLSLAIGMGIILLDVIQNAITVADLVQKNMEAGLIGNGLQGISLFSRWIAVNGFTFGSVYFYLVWPVLAAMPYGWSYAQEAKSGILNQYLARTSRSAYFFAKYAAVFLTGGFAVACPVFTDLLLNALFCPVTVPEVTHLLTGITDGYFMSDLFYTHPWCYAVLWCCVEFLYGGAAACLCFLAGSRMKFSVMVMLVPFGLLYILDIIGTFILTVTHVNLALTPLDQAMAASSVANPEWIVFGTIGVLIIISLIIGYWQVTRHELP